MIYIYHANNKVHHFVEEHQTARHIAFDRLCRSPDKASRAYRSSDY